MWEAACATTGYSFTTSGCSAISPKRTEAPISKLFSPALIVCNSCTRFMLISTGGATMPRRILTTRSVPPPSGLLSGCAARAAMTSSSVAGLSTRNSGSASITHHHFSLASCRRRACASRSPQHAIRCHRQIVESDADGVGDGVGQGGQEGGERSFARFLAPNGPCGSCFRRCPLRSAGSPGMVGTRSSTCRGDHQAVVIGGPLHSSGLGPCPSRPNPALGLPPSAGSAPCRSHVRPRPCRR